MNWKFWQKQAASPARYFQRPRVLTDAEQGRANLERLLALADVGDANPVWKTLLSYADEHAANEQEAALRPDLSNEVRQYNAGRAASALDFATALRDLRAEAKRQAEKQKKE